jgi:hypothetical protein
MAAETKETKRLAPEQPATIKVKVIGPGSITYGSSEVGVTGSVVTLTAVEFESVKDSVTKL